jgi:hypothetical protein
VNSISQIQNKYVAKNSNHCWSELQPCKCKAQKNKDQRNKINHLNIQQKEKDIFVIPLSCQKLLMKQHFSKVLQKTWIIKARPSCKSRSFRRWIRNIEQAQKVKKYSSNCTMSLPFSISISNLNRTHCLT